MSLTHLIQEKTQKSENDSWADFESSSFPDMKNKSAETASYFNGLHMAYFKPLTITRYFYRKI